MIKRSSVHQLGPEDHATQTWQTCPVCGFQFQIAEDELAGEQVVCLDCGEFFDFDRSSNC